MVDIFEVDTSSSIFTERQVQKSLFILIFILNFLKLIVEFYMNDRLNYTCSEFGASRIFTKPISRESYEKMIDDFLEFIEL